LNITVFLTKFISWASAQPDVTGVALVGSHAHGTARPESDVDIMVLATNVEGYFQDKTWASLFGQLERVEEEHWGAVETLRAFYKNGGEAEFNFSVPDWAGIPVDPGTHRVVSDGIKILYDPQNLLRSVQQTVLDKTVLDSKSKQ